MRKRSDFCFKARSRNIDKVFMIVVAVVLLALTGCSSGLHQAAETGNMKKLKALLEENPSAIDEKDSYGMTALHWAVDKGNRDVALFLIEKGAVLNVKDRNGETPLNYAISKESAGMAALLLLKGATLTGSEDEIRASLKRIAPLHRAARDDRVEDVNAFLKRYPDQVDVLDRSGRTPLYWAARAGHKDVCEALLAGGADINATTMDGFSALHGAVYYKKTETVELLLAKGAKVNVKSNEGETPLHWAARGGKTKVVELLLAKGADPKVKDNEGKTAIEWAEDNDIIELLRKQGAED